MVNGGLAQAALAALVDVMPTPVLAYFVQIKVTQRFDDIVVHIFLPLRLLIFAQRRGAT